MVSVIYELRIYRCVARRLPALLRRFETTTLELWKRHEMTGLRRPDALTGASQGA